jgi:hypothetical protein
VPRDLGFDQALKPIGERATILLRKPLSRRFYGWSHAHMHHGFASFRRGSEPAQAHQRMKIYLVVFADAARMLCETKLFMGDQI